MLELGMWLMQKVQKIKTLGNTSFLWYKSAKYKADLIDV